MDKVGCRSLSVIHQPSTTFALVRIVAERRAQSSTEERKAAQDHILTTACHLTCQGCSSAGLQAPTCAVPGMGAPAPGSGGGEVARPPSGAVRHLLHRGAPEASAVGGTCGAGASSGAAGRVPTSPNGASAGPGGRAVGTGLASGAPGAGAAVKPDLWRKAGSALGARSSSKPACGTQ
jgi:hypothetical protein